MALIKLYRKEIVIYITVSAEAIAELLKSPRTLDQVLEIRAWPAEKSEPIVKFAK